MIEEQRVVLVGGSGFLGRALAANLLASGYAVTIVSRSDPHIGPRIRYVPWDGRHLGEWQQQLDGAQAVVNLAGRSVNCRYTPENRREILDSRLDSVRVIGEAIATCDRPPDAWVQASSLAIYGDAGARVCDEDAPAGSGFPAEVCLNWERAFNEAHSPSTRKVLLRIGFVLGPDGGALQTLGTLARWFIGGAAGSGHQYVSWLHMTDMNTMFRWGIERQNVAGVYNATAPQPVTNGAFMREVRRALHRPWCPPAPAPLVRLGARLLGTEGELALTGRRCIPRRFTKQGFTFAYPYPAPALRDLLR